MRWKDFYHYIVKEKVGEADPVWGDYFNISPGAWDTRIGFSDKTQNP